MLERFIPVAATVTGFAAACAAQTGSLTIVPNAWFLGLSADGQVAVGRGPAPGTSSPLYALRWTEASGPVVIGPGTATSVSADGSVVVGLNPISGGNEVFRWTASGSTVIGTCSNAVFPAVSRDGSTVVFKGLNSRAYRWTAGTGSVQLPGLPGSGDMAPRSVSADGSVIGGFNQIPSVGLKAFSWTSGVGTAGLPWLTSAYDASVTAVSADGGRLFGYSATGQLAMESVYWDAAGVLHRLYSPDSLSQIWTVDGAGTTAIALGPNGTFVWQEDAGWNELTTLLLTDFNIDLTTESSVQAQAISDDGRSLAGWGNVGSGREAWIVRLPSPLRVLPACYANCDNSAEPPVLNVADFTCFLSKFASGVPYANCDGSTSPPVVNIADFTCFLQRFAGGCP